MHPREFCRQLADWRRGGLPGASLSSGSPSAETPVPHLDKTDMVVNALLESYGQLLAAAMRAEREGRIAKAREHIARALELETGVLLQRHMTPKEWADYLNRCSLQASGLIGATPCANPNCQRPVRNTKTDRLIEERCSACYEFRGDHEGKERPKRLCERDDERLRKSA